MKPQLENVSIPSDQSSFRFYHSRVKAFEPYWHFHPEVELTWIEQGGGVRFVGDHISNYQSGDLVLTGENLPHHWVSDKNSGHDLRIASVIQFSGELFTQFPECSHITRFLEQAKTGFYFPNPGKKVYQKIKSIGKQTPLVRLISLIEILDVLSTDIEKQKLSGISFSENSSWKRHNSRISEITAYVLNNLSENLPLEKMADLSNMTPPSFSRWFRQSTGKSFVIYLNTVRIEKACEMLLTSDLPIINIAMDVGFESLSNFNRNFKKLKKISPREYRNLISV